MDVLFESLKKYYKNTEIMDKLLSILSGKDKISLRIIDWFVTNYSKKKSSQDGGSNNKSKNGKAMWAFDRHMPWDPRSSVTTKNSNGDIRSSIDDLEVRKVLKNANRVPKKIDRLKDQIMMLHYLLFKRAIGIRKFRISTHTIMAFG